MPTSTDVTNLKINTLTEAQYDTAVQGGVIGANELSVITDMDDAIQVTALPTASADELGKVYQFIGTTDANYTHGYFYECVSDGQVPATYSWTQTNVQPAPSGLPSQTGHGGEFLITDGTDASWGTTITDTLQIYLPYGNYSPFDLKGPGGGSRLFVTLGSGYNTASTYLNVSYNGNGGNFFLSYDGSTSGHKALRFYASTSQYVDEVELGKSSDKWTRVYAVNINNGADIAVPTTGGTMALLSDIPSGPVVPTTMPELTVVGWSSNTQTVTVTGVTASNTVFVSPAPASASDYASAGIICTAQGTDSLTFTCTTVPSNAITVNVIIMG